MAGEMQWAALPKHWQCANSRCKHRCKHRCKRKCKRRCKRKHMCRHRCSISVRRRHRQLTSCERRWTHCKGSSPRYLPLVGRPWLTVAKAMKLKMMAVNFAEEDCSALAATVVNSNSLQMANLLVQRNSIFTLCTLDQIFLRQL